jgi:hypothetical protein
MRDTTAGFERCSIIGILVTTITEVVQISKILTLSGPSYGQTSESENFEYRGRGNSEGRCSYWYVGLKGLKIWTNTS